jgi:hypothetical protein
MMRSYDDIDLSQHRPSRVGRVVVILSTLGALSIAAWAFAPILVANYTAVAAHLFAGPKTRPAAQEQPAAPLLASAQAATQAATPAAAQAAPAAPAAPSAPAAAPPPVTTAVAATDDQASPPAAPPAPPSATMAAAAPANTTASTSWSTPPWPQNRGIQAAAPAAPPAPPASLDTMQVASAAADTPAEAFENVPLPRKRPSRLIATSLAIPLPRPRPEIEADAPAAPSVFDLQVERMR